MKVYRHWARDNTLVRAPGKEWNIVCFGSSKESFQEAAQDARTRVERLKSAILTGRRPDSYEYSDRPLREELKREIHQDGKLTAVITRNRYGALVLNTEKVMFIDIDVVPEGHRKGPSLFFRLFGKKAKWELKLEKRWKDSMDGLRVNAERQGIGMRIYRTPNGYRCLVTSRTFEPTSDETRAIMEEFGSDRLYIKLCRVQECFRARLTPKPFRIRLWNPPSRFPWMDPHREQAYRDWEQRYEGMIVDYSACTFLEHCGDLFVKDDIGEIVGIHDAIACTGNPIA